MREREPDDRANAPQRISGLHVIVAGGLNGLPGAGQRPE